MDGQTIHLQGIGRQHAIRARYIEPGMRLCWNYSYGEYEVVEAREFFVQRLAKRQESR